MLVVFINLIVLIIKGHYQPFESKFTNKIQIFSDLSILMISDSLLLFTDYIDKTEDKFNAAWLTCSILTFFILGSLYITISNLSWSLKLIYFKKI